MLSVKIIVHCNHSPASFYHHWSKDYSDTLVDLWVEEIADATIELLIRLCILFCTLFDIISWLYLWNLCLFTFSHPMLQPGLSVKAVYGGMQSSFLFYSGTVLVKRCSRASSCNFMFSFLQGPKHSHKSHFGMYAVTVPPISDLFPLNFLQSCILWELYFILLCVQGYCGTRKIQESNSKLHKGLLCCSHCIRCCKYESSYKV